MKHEEKKKKVLSIADELEKLGYPEVAAELREAVTSGKPQSNESTTEEGEGDEEEGGGGGNHPPKKGGN